MESASRQPEAATSRALVQVLTCSRRTARRLQPYLQSSGHLVRWAPRPPRGDGWAVSSPPEALILEVRRGDRHVLPFLQRLAAEECDACVILIGPEQPADVVAQLLRSGAFDYCTLQALPYRLGDSLAQGLEIRRSFKRVQNLSDQLTGINQQLAHERDGLERWNHQLAALNRLSQRLAASLNQEQAHHALELGLRNLLPFDLAGVVWRKPELTWVLVSGAGLFEQDETVTQRLQARANRMVESWDVQAERAVRPHVEWRDSQSVSVLEYPLIVRREVQGTLYLERRDGRRFDDMECELVSSLATSLALALHNADSYRAVQEMATFDGLTGLRNRRAFNEAVEREFHESRRYRTQACLLLIDLDHFKRINDQFGHLAGDTVLQSVGTLLVTLARSVDIVARYGGEEFGIVLPHTGLDQACSLAARIRQQLEQQTFHLGGTAVRMTMSLGVAALPHAGIASPNAWIGAADEALYAAKSQGRNRVVIHGASTDEAPPLLTT